MAAAPPSDVRFRSRLAAITVAALLVRVVYVAAVRPRVALPTPDAFLYHHGANVLADGHGFIDPYSWLRAGLIEPAADHPPGYLLYLAAFSLMGITSALGHMVVSTFLGAATVVMVGLVGREVRGPRTGLVAASLAAGYPALVLADGSLQSESLAVLVTTAVVYGALRYRRHPTLSHACGLGALVGLAALTRAELALLGLVVVVPTVWVAAERWRPRVGRVAAAALVAVAILSPWAAYNLTRFHHPVLLGTNVDYTIATTNCPTTWSGPRMGFWDHRCNLRYLRDAGMDMEDGDGSDRAVVWRRAGLHYLGGHLSRLPAVLAVRVARLVNVWHPMGQLELDRRSEGRERAMSLMAMLAFWVLALLATAGLWTLRRQRILLLQLGGPLLVVLIAAAAFMGNARYRVPAEGALCVLAAIASQGFGRRAGEDDLAIVEHEDSGAVFDDEIKVV